MQRRDGALRKGRAGHGHGRRHRSDADGLRARDTDRRCDGETPVQCVVARARRLTARFRPQPAFEHGRSPKIGVLIVNLGTPDAPTPAAVRRYLKEFLTDPRVIEKDSIFWKLLLNTFILSLRSRRRARDYEKIWNREKDESPFKTITRTQAEKLSEILEPLGKHVIVDWAMRYGNPSIASRLEVLVTWGCERILIMPLYPQYSAATTATVCDEVFRFMLQQRRQPALRVL